MEHDMKLNAEPFEKIKSGQKTIEMRLFDEKRQKVNLGDVINFENRQTGEILRTKVLSLHRFRDFSALYKHFDRKALGYVENEVADPKDMQKYYSSSDIKKYGTLGIEIKVLKGKKNGRV